MSKSKLSTKDLIQPLVTVNGNEHAFKALMNASEMPELKAVGVIKLPDTNTWVDYVITTKGREVLSIEVGEPNLRQIVEDMAKINFVEQFMGSDL